MKTKHVISGVLLALLFTLQPIVQGEESGTATVTGTTADIQWGQHWAGPELLGPISLRGKVVLLKIWGG